MRAGEGGGEVPLLPLAAKWGAGPGGVAPGSAAAGAGGCWFAASACGWDEPMCSMSRTTCCCTAAQAASALPAAVAAGTDMHC